MIVKKLVVMGKKKDQAHYLKVGEIFAGSLPQQEGQKSKCSCILMHLSGGGGVGGCCSSGWGCGVPQQSCWDILGSRARQGELRMLKDEGLLTKMHMHPNWPYGCHPRAEIWEEWDQGVS